MNEQTAHITAQQYAQKKGVQVNAVRMALKRAAQKRGEVLVFSADMILTPDLLSALEGGRKRSITKVHVQKPAAKALTGNLKNEAVVLMTKSPAQTVKQASGFNFRRPAMYGLMLMPLAISLQNMHSINLEMSGMETKAIGMTGMFSILPAAFVIFGIRGLIPSIVTAVLIGYEAFCNTVTVFNWLTGFGKGDVPIPFLWKVCEFLQSNPYSTARFLAVGFSLMVAAAFYAVVLNLNRK